MKKVMMIGPVGSGKTSLIQALKGMELQYVKTQAVEFDGGTIDTPGEYIENRQYLQALTVTAYDADIVIFTQDPTSNIDWYSPGQASMFNSRVIGVITKIDCVPQEQIDYSREILELAGAERVFAISNVNGSGVDKLREYLREQGVGTSGEE